MGRVGFLQGIVFGTEVKQDFLLIVETGSTKAASKPDGYQLRWHKQDRAVYDG
jgi:hypothetical protein